MILSATQLFLATELIERTGYVRIVFDSQDPNTLAVTARIGGDKFEISDLGLFQIVPVRPANDPGRYYRKIQVDVDMVGGE